MIREVAKNLSTWRLQRSLVPENEDHGRDVGTVWKNWKWHEGGWYYDLWVHSDSIEHGERTCSEPCFWKFAEAHPAALS